MKSAASRGAPGEGEERGVETVPRGAVPRRPQRRPPAPSTTRGRLMNEAEQKDLNEKAQRERTIEIDNNVAMLQKIMK